MKKGKWTALCTLTVQGLRPGKAQDVVVQAALTPPDRTAAPRAAAPAVFGAAEWSWHVPELRLSFEAPPPEFGPLARTCLTDPAAARVMLERGLRAVGLLPDDLRIQSCVPEVLRLKAGGRCTIRYRLAYPRGQTANVLPDRVIAKTYSDDKGPDVLAAMRALWASPLSRGDAVRIAEPLGFLPEFNMLLQWPVPERQNLKDLIRSAAGGTAEALEALRAVMNKTAIGMAALHSSGVLHGRTFSWEDACDELDHTIKQLATVNAALAAVASRLLGRVVAFAAAVPADLPVPTHGSFRPNQVLLYEGDVSFIDFDKYGQAEPALDLSLFLSATKNFALSRPHGEESDEEDVALDPASRLAILDQMDSVCAGFMEQYARRAPVSRARVVAWEALNLLELVLECWVKVKPVRLSNTLLMLERHFQSHGLL
ncbi:MAG TPA: hypothetical protein VFD82_07070 [Planctomycetota bacterium]|nr:hypothetical protein [Planctomycetota bacterium]